MVEVALELPEGGGTVELRGRAARARVQGITGVEIDLDETSPAWLARVEELIASVSLGTAEKTARMNFQPALSVLVVDDDERYRERIAELFRRRGDVVRTCRDGVDALAQCLKQTPDVILSDVHMPRMDGWQLLRVIRARATLAAVPVVFLTTLDGEAARLAGFQLGVDDYIPKPCRAEEILARVDRVVQRTLAAGPSGGGAEGRMLRGDLAQVSVSSVLALIELERKSGVLVIDGEHTARLTLRDGRPLRIEVYGADAGASPIDLFVELLDWKRGEFDFEISDAGCEDEFRSTVTQLLLEAARRADEAKRPT
jgi:DNA-binding response OmpR family regulator